jgi:hypothetical protein
MKTVLADETSKKCKYSNAKILSNPIINRWHWTTWTYLAEMRKLLEKKEAGFLEKFNLIFIFICLIIICD